MQLEITRRLFTLSCIATVSSLGGLKPATAAPKALQVGVTGTPTDIGLYLAERHGYFRQEGLNVDLKVLSNLGSMLNAIANGAIEIGGGALTPAMYNAVRTGPFRIVADKGSVTPVNQHFRLVVRSDLVKTASFSSLSDLKGLRIGIPPAMSVAGAARLNAILEEAGLNWGDIAPYEIGLSMFVTALSRGEIDAALITEPTASLLGERGIAKRIVAADRIYARQQLGVLLYASSFISAKRVEGEKFMRAYLRGVRYFNNALIAGRLVGPNSEDVIETLTIYTPVRDKDLLRNLTLPVSDPDGTLETESMMRDLAFFKSRKWIDNSAIKVENMIDRSFADRALRDLGRNGSYISKIEGWKDG